MLPASVEELLTIRSPDWLRTAVVGNLNLVAQFRKGLNVNLGATRFIRGVSEPASVRGNSAAVLTELGLQERLGGNLTIEAEKPEVVTGDRIAIRDDNGTSIS